MNPAEIRTEAEFYALALAMECQAAERYADLAEQLEIHNNRETASLFRRLAEIETRHVGEIRARATIAGFDVEATPVPPFVTAEEVPFEEAHYLMTPHHALLLALRNEEQAAVFFAELERTTSSDKVRRLAAAARDEELQHQERVRAWLAAHPLPAQGWAYDPDPPVYSE